MALILFFTSPFSFFFPQQSIQALPPLSAPVPSTQTVEEVIEDLSEAIRIEPNNKSAYYNRGIAYLKNENFEAALRDFQKTANLNPDQDNKTEVNSLISHLKFVILYNKLSKIEQPVTAGNYLLMVNQKETSRSGNYYDYDAEDGNELVSVDVTISSTRDSGVSANLLYATLSDANGYTYKPILFGKEPSPAAVNDIPTNRDVRGWITFEVPRNSKGLIFQYTPPNLGKNSSLEVALETSLNLQDI